jgi:hypothetical protein
MFTKLKGTSNNESMDGVVEGLPDHKKPSCPTRFLRLFSLLPPEPEDLLSVAKSPDLLGKPLTFCYENDLYL